MKTAAVHRSAGPRGPRPIPVVAGWVAACAAGLLAAGCASAPGGLEQRSPPAPLTVEHVLAPVVGSGQRELRELHRAGEDNGAFLRRAWIYLETGRSDDSLELINRILYGADRAAPAEEAMARYIRGEVWRRRGDTDRARYDFGEAESLALDPALRDRVAEALRPMTPRTEGAGPAPRFLERLAWRPAKAIPSRLDPMGRIFRVTVHHSAMFFRDPSTEAAAAHIRRIQRNHQAQGWADIGYHLLIDPAGRIWQGRDLRYQGAHSRDDNNIGNVGVCLLGNFVHGAQRPTPAQVSTMRRLLVQILDKYDIPPEQVKTHRQFVVTECPGENLQAEVDRFVADLRRWGADSVAGR